MDVIPLTESILGATAAIAAIAIALLPDHRDRDVAAILAALLVTAMVAIDLAPWWTLLGVIAVVLVGDDVASPPTATRVIPATRWIALATISLGITDTAPLELRIGAVVVAVVLVGAIRLTGHPPAVVTALATISAAGIYVNVPDTEHVTVVGAGLACLTMGLTIVHHRSTRPVGLLGVAGTATLLMASAAVDARGRPGAFIGVIGALGGFLAEPVAQRLRRYRPTHVLPLLVIHTAVAITIGRLATDLDTGPLIAATAIALGAATVLLTISPRIATPPGGLRAE